MSVTVTRNAWKKMSSILQNVNNKSGFLFSAKSGGCNGFNFDLSPLDDRNIFKINPTVISNDDIKLYIDPISEMYLIGTEIDYIKEDYSKQIFESKFTFTPEKDIASTCGCGVSFSPK